MGLSNPQHTAAIQLPAHTGQRSCASLRRALPYLSPLHECRFVTSEQPAPSAPKTPRLQGGTLDPQKGKPVRAPQGIVVLPSPGPCPGSAWPWGGHRSV